jgi:hypothetical protein
VFCACEIILSFSVVFGVITAVHKFDFRLVIKETHNKWRPLERKSCSDVDSSICVPLPVTASVMGLYLRCAGQMQSLESETVLPR